jgi:hypothetical protein
MHKHTPRSSLFELAQSLSYRAQSDELGYVSQQTEEDAEASAKSNSAMEGLLKALGPGGGSGSQHPRPMRAASSSSAAPQADAALQ